MKIKPSKMCHRMGHVWPRNRPILDQMGIPTSNTVKGNRCERCGKYRHRSGAQPHVGDWGDEGS